MRGSAFVVACGIGLGVGPIATSAQNSNCADCHVANPDAPELGHLIEWERSAHGRERVGCEACHGGDASTFDRLAAHLGVLGSGNPASPAHRANLPRTCGKCHSGPFVAFQKSRHFALLEEGDRAVPVCSTCHGAVAATLLSPRALESQCVRCHRDGGPAPEHAPLAARARELLTGVEEVRGLLRHAGHSIRRVDDAERRRRLEQQLEQAEVPLREAVESGHAFAFDALEERLGTARGRSEALVDALANPAAP